MKKDRKTMEEQVKECFPISKETFKTLSPQNQNVVLYECIQHLYRGQEEFLKTGKFIRKAQMAVAGIAGFIGGLVGFVTGLDKLLKP